MGIYSESFLVLAVNGVLDCIKQLASIPFKSFTQWLAEDKDAIDQKIIDNFSSFFSYINWTHWIEKNLSDFFNKNIKIKLKIKKPISANFNR